MGTDLDKVGHTQQGIVDYVRQREEGLKPSHKTQTTSVKEYLGGDAPETRSEELELERESSKPLKRSAKDPQPLRHWSEHIQSKFESVPKSTQQAWLDSFKIVEKGFVKQLNALKDDIQSAAAIFEVIEPYYEEIMKTGMTPAEYFKNLIAFDYMMGKDPAYEISKLILRHNVQYEDIYWNLVEAEEDIKEEAKVSKHLAPLKAEIESLKDKLGYHKRPRDVEAKAEELFEKIKNFYSQVDEQGNELYPGAFDYIEDIIEVVQTGETLEDAYDLVMGGKRLREDFDDTPEANEDSDPHMRPARRDHRDDEKDYLKDVMRGIGL